jgi:taurine dioxygenase
VDGGCSVVFDGGVGISVEPSNGVVGASVLGIDLARPSDDDIGAIRAAWLRHQVIELTGADTLTIEQFRGFAQRLGTLGDDPYLPTLPGQPHVVELKREADETSTLFAESWHSDWSFMASPPIGTLLHGIEIPPVGGDTRFCDLYAAYDALPDDLRSIVDSTNGVHSAMFGYSKKGLYGDNDQGRSMAIRSDDSAMATQAHPMARRHPETGRTALFVSPSYTIGVEGMDRDEGRSLLMQLFAHLAQPEFEYRHRWTPGTILLWDNRCLNHAATGGYDGYRRRLNRITIYA